MTEQKITSTEMRDNNNSVLILYALLGLGILLSFIPSISAAILALILFLAGWVGAYIVRSGTPELSFKRMHTTHIIRTVWWANLIVLIGVIIACIYMIKNVDNEPLDICLNTAVGIDPYASMNENMAMLRPCIDDYVAINKAVLVKSTAIAALPVILFFLVQFFRGFVTALRGKTITSKKPL